MNSIFQGTRTLVTGADGFIGSHLVEVLVKRGTNVRAFVYYNSFNTWGWIDTLPEDILGEVEIFPGDIRDAGRVGEAIKGCDNVFHLASLIAIPYSYHAPESYVQTNVGGALNILKACKSQGVDRLIHTSTSEVYGTAQYVPIDEQHPLQGQSPYSASKIGADMLAESYHRSFGLPVITVRPFNTYGPRQSSRAVIPTIISQIASGAETIRLGSLSPTRDFNFVSDTAEGFIACAESPETVGSVVNIGSGREISIGDLAELIMTIMNRRVKIITAEDRLRPEKSEVNRLLCNAGLARELTGWKPIYSLEDGLKLTAEWIAENLDSFRTDRYVV